MDKVRTRSLLCTGIESNTYDLTRMNTRYQGIMPYDVAHEMEVTGHISMDNPAMTYDPLYVDAVVGSYSQRWEPKGKEIIHVMPAME